MITTNQPKQEAHKMKLAQYFPGAKALMSGTQKGVAWKTIEWKMDDNSFLKARESCPFRTVWHGSTRGIQYFVVFNELN